MNGRAVRERLGEQYEEVWEQKIPTRELLRQHLKETWRAWRHGHQRPALWETRQWLQLTKTKR